MDSTQISEVAVPSIYGFGEFTLDLNRGALSKAGAEIKLRPKSLEVLAYLLRHHGRLVSKDELMAAVWGRVVVTDGSLTQCLIDIRRALDDRSQRMIRTVPRRGYLLDVPVFEIDRATRTQNDGAVAEVPSTSAHSRRDRTPRARAVFVAIVVVGLAAASLVAAIIGFDAKRSASGRNGAPKALAVLPFADLSREHDLEYFADGIAEEILDLLAQTRALPVIARTSSFAFKGSNSDIGTIAAKLNVGYVVEGSVRKSGDRIRVAAKLVDAATGSSVWSETYDRKLDDALSLQTEIATAVAQSLNIRLASAGRRDIASPSAEASARYLEGRFFYNRRAPGDVAKAIELYEEAVRLDPAYARPWVGLAAAYNVEVADGAISRDVGLAKRRLALERALSVGPDLADAHVQAARMAWQDGDAAATAEHYRRAVALAPDSPSVLTLSANVATWNDRLDEAIALARRVVLLDPASSVAREHLASLLLFAGELDAAKAEYLKALDLRSTTNPETDPNIGFILILQHEFDEAQRMVAHWPEGDDRDQALALIGPSVGRNAEADAAILRLGASKQLGSVVRLAEIHAFRGENEEAFRWLQAARARFTPESWSSPDLDWLERWRFSPFLRRLHADSRWAQLRPSPKATVASR